MKLQTLTPWALAVLTATALVGAIAALSRSSIDVDLVVARLRIGEPLRPLVVAAVASTILLAIRWKRPTWRAIAFFGLGVCAIVFFPTITRSAGPKWPTGDNAMIELYTLHAAHGRQLVGAYSQYGWHHPGPMMFYLMAPVYALGDHSTASIWAAAATINLLSLSTLVWLLWRRNSNAIFGVVLAALLVLYLARLPGLMTNVWNPHLALLPFVTFLVLAGETLSGDMAIVPLLAIFGSLVIQAHVGFVPTVFTLLITCAVRLGFALWNRTLSRGVALRSSLMTVALLEVAWLLPVAQQLTGNPGNMTRLWRFFVEGDQPQPLHAAWTASTGMLAGIFLPDFRLAIGWGWTPGTTLWPAILVGTVLMSLAAIAIWESRLKQPALAPLAIVCLLATASAFWSVRHLRGPIVDNQIFWVSSLGFVSAALPLTVVIETLVSRLVPARWISTLRIVPACAVTLVAVVTVVSIIERAHSDEPLDDEAQAVKVLVEQSLDTLPSIGATRLLVRVDPAIWRVAAGVVLELAKKSVPVGADELADFFGPPLYPTGSEDVLLFISSGERHKQLIANPEVTSIGAFRGSWFVDVMRIHEDNRQKP